MFNSDTETINANIAVANEIDRWKRKAGFSILRTVNEDVTSADRWELRGQSEYSLTERSFVFGSLRYEDDRFTDLPGTDETDQVLSVNLVYGF